MIVKETDKEQRRVIPLTLPCVVTLSPTSPLAKTSGPNLADPGKRQQMWQDVYLEPKGRKRKKKNDKKKDKKEEKTEELKTTCRRGGQLASYKVPNSASVSFLGVYGTKRQRTRGTGR